jgi:hypothetical protein
VKEIPQTYQFEGREVSFARINNLFSQTSYGNVLKENVRYSPYKTENIEKETWEKLLGADVNNFNHLFLTKGLTYSFIKACDNPGPEWDGKATERATFSDRDKQILLLTATVHDWPEAITGDIPYPAKQKEDEDREMIILRGMFKEVLENEGISDTDIESTTAEIITVLLDKNTKLGRAFNTIEQLGYMRTGINAFNRSKNEHGLTKERLEFLGCKVTPHHLPYMLEYADVYPPVRSFIEYHRDVISEIFNVGETNPDCKAFPRFLEAREEWFKSSFSNSSVIM